MPTKTHTFSDTRLRLSRRRLLAVSSGVGIGGFSRMAAAQELPPCRQEVQNEHWETTVWALGIRSHDEQGGVHETYTSLKSDWNLVIKFTREGIAENKQVVEASLNYLERGNLAFDSSQYIGGKHFFGFKIDDDQTALYVTDVKTEELGGGIQINDSDDAERLYERFQTGREIYVFRAATTPDAGTEPEIVMEEVVTLENAGNAVAAAHRIGVELEAARAAEKCEGLTSQCYITTATCGFVGLSDDCFELTQLRRFRDGWLAKRKGGPDVIKQYYRDAPRVLAHLRQSESQDEVLLSVYARTILPAVIASLLGMNWLAYVLYKRMCQRLTTQCQTD